MRAWCRSLSSPGSRGCEKRPRAAGRPRCSEVLSLGGREGALKDNRNGKSGEALESGLSPCCARAGGPWEGDRPAAWRVGGQTRVGAARRPSWAGGGASGGRLLSSLWKAGGRWPGLRLSLHVATTLWMPHQWWPFHPCTPAFSVSPWVALEGWGGENTLEVFLSPAAPAPPPPVLLSCLG